MRFRLTTTKSRKIFGLGSALILATGLAACGSSSSSTTTTAAGSATTAAKKTYTIAY